MKRYPEYEFEQMKRDLRNFEIDDWDDDWDEDDDNQIRIKYYNRSEFEELENLILWKPYKMVKKRNTFKLLHEDCFCDYFCKMIISYYANTDREITPTNLHSSSLAERNLIVSGRYTEWKGYLVDSDLAKRFGVKALKYEKPDLDGLFLNTYSCVYILKEYIEENANMIIFDYDEVSEDAYDLYMIIDKVIDAYYKKQIKLILSKREKNIISDLLLGEKLEKVQLLYDLRSKDTTHKNFMNQSQLRDICERLKKINPSDWVEDREFKIKNVNADKRHVRFPEYLSPIIAAICENRENNPFYHEENIRGAFDKKVKYFNISEIENVQKDFLTREFAKYLRYFKFENRRIDDKNVILEKYYYFLNLLINKINMYKSNYDNKYIHYYLVEKMMGMQLFDVETKIILNYIESDLTNFKKKHSELRELLKAIYEFRGCLSRITLSQSVLKEYFSTYKESGKVDICDIKKRIEHTDVVDKIRERLYIEDFTDEQEILLGQYENAKDHKEGSNLEMLRSRLKDYYNYEEIIKVDNKELDNLKFSRHIQEKEIKKIVSYQIKKQDDMWNEIKKWVILKSFF